MEHSAHITWTTFMLFLWCFYAYFCPLRSGLLLLTKRYKKLLIETKAEIIKYKIKKYDSEALKLLK